MLKPLSPLQQQIFRITLWLGVLSFSSHAIADELFFGVDLSYVNEVEDCDGYYQTSGVRTDPFKIFHDHGANIVRVRLWHSPDWTEYSTFDDVVKTLRRSKENNMRTMLDFHYSDDWADPAKQLVPAAWRKHLDDHDALAEALYQYTYDTLLKLHQRDLLPDVVQIGNEINPGLALAKIWEEADGDIGVDWPRTALLVNAGIRAVRDVEAHTSSQITVMLHIAQPENVEKWFTAGEEAGIQGYDIIGISYYPRWSTHSFAKLEQTIRKLRHRFGKRVMVVETAYPWTLDWNDQAGNIMGKEALYGQYAPTIDGQRQYMIDLTQAIIAGGGDGIVYWEPAWVSNSCATRWGVGSHWENMTFFDFNKDNEVHAGIDFLSYEYDFPVTIRFEVTTDQADGLLLWGNFLESNTYVVPMQKQQGGYYFETRIMPRSEIYYQIYPNTDSFLDKGLLPSVSGEDPDGFVSLIVKDDTQTIAHTL